MAAVRMCSCLGATCPHPPDPALLATLPAAALIYRQGHVREAAATYVFDPGAEMLFGQAISPANALGRLVIAMPQTKELPWLARSALPSQAIVLRDPTA